MPSQTGPIGALIEQVIRNPSKTRMTFGGSGWTLTACEKTERRARLVEVDPKYVDTIFERWQRSTVERACHAD